MNEKTKNLRMRKLTGSFPGLAVVLLSFSLAFTACDSPAGTDSGKTYPIVIEPYDPSNPPPGIYPPEKTISESWEYKKKIYVKFEVRNGGCGLIRSAGILSDSSDIVLIYKGNDWAGDYEITYPVLKEDHNEWMWVRWAGRDFFNRWTYVKGKFCPKNTSTIITFDYNGYCNVKSTISGFTVTGNDSDWADAMKRLFYQQ